MDSGVVFKRRYNLIRAAHLSGEIITLCDWFAQKRQTLAVVADFDAVALAVMDGTDDT